MREFYDSGLQKKSEMQKYSPSIHVCNSLAICFPPFDACVPLYSPSKCKKIRNAKICQDDIIILAWQIMLAGWMIPTHPNTLANPTHPTSFTLTPVSDRLVIDF